MRALSECMNTRVRSTGAVDANLISGDARECAFEMVLDRIAIALALPAGKAGPVVRHGKFHPPGAKVLAALLVVRQFLPARRRPG